MEVFAKKYHENNGTKYNSPKSKLSMPMRDVMSLLAKKYIPDYDVERKLTHICLMNELLSLKRFNRTCISCSIGNMDEWWEWTMYSVSSYYWEQPGINTRSSMSGLIYSCKTGGVEHINRWITKKEADDYTHIRNGLCMYLNNYRDNNDDWFLTNRRYRYAANNCEEYMGFHMIGLRRNDRSLNKTLCNHYALSPATCKLIKRPDLLPYCI